MCSFLQKVFAQAIPADPCSTGSFTLDCGARFQRICCMFLGQS